MSAPAPAHAARAWPGWLDSYLLAEVIAHRRADLDEEGREKLLRETQAIIDRDMQSPPSEYWL